MNNSYFHTLPPSSSRACESHSLKARLTKFSFLSFSSLHLSRHFHM